jgi:uncharacterized protein (TIGR03663 family)
LPGRNDRLKLWKSGYKQIFAAGRRPGGVFVSKTTDKSVGRRPAPGRKAITSGQPPVSRERHAGPLGRRVEERQVPLAFGLGGAAILLTTIILRFYQLGAAAFDHDEGVNGLFVYGLLRDHAYRYNPEMFHGPTLYYLSLAVTSLNRLLFNPAGVSETALRWVPAIFGVATVWLVLRLRPWLGLWGCAGAGALLAVSPANVYYSRFFIHEASFVFFTLGIVVAALGYGASRHRAAGRPKTSSATYLRLGAASAAMLLATKETAFISVGVLGLAYACMVLYLKWSPFAGKNLKIQGANSAPDLPAGNSKLETGNSSGWISAGIIFVAVYLAFYSSFGTNLHGIVDSIRAFAFWSKSGVHDQLGDGRWAYVIALLKEELAILVLGVGGFALALYRARNRFAIFCGFWALGMLAAYTLIPYKTPWLMLNIVLPFALSAGYAIEELCGFLRSRGIWLRVALGCVLAVAIGGSAYHAINISFFRWDDVWASYYCDRRTQRPIVDLVNRINEIASQNGKGHTSFITATAEETVYPLSWYLRDYYNMGFWEQLNPRKTDIYILRRKQAPAVMSYLGDAFAYAGAYRIRPDVVLVVLARTQPHATWQVDPATDQGK